MLSEIRIIILIVVVLALAAYAARSWAAPVGIHSEEARLTAPPPLQTALVRSAAGASIRSVSGF